MGVVVNFLWVATLWGNSFCFTSSRRRSEAQATLLAGSEGGSLETPSVPGDSRGSDVITDESAAASASGFCGERKGGR
jgi:hypothetical protein